jgi:uncharacterized protein (DUF3084 family)
MHTGYVAATTMFTKTYVFLNTDLPRKLGQMVRRPAANCLVRAVKASLQLTALRSCPRRVRNLTRALKHLRRHQVPITGRRQLLLDPDQVDRYEAKQWQRLVCTPEAEAKHYHVYVLVCFAATL